MTSTIINTTKYGYDLSDIPVEIDIVEEAQTLQQELVKAGRYPEGVTFEQFCRQIELEERMRGLGIRRFRDNTEKAKSRGEESERDSVRRQMDVAIDAMIKGIEEFIAAANTGMAGRKHKVVKYLNMIEPKAAAFLAVKAVFDNISQTSPLQTIALAVGRLIEDELRFRHFKEQKKAYAGKVIDHVSKKSGNYNYQRTVTVNSMNKIEVAWEDWPIADRAHLGVKLIEMLVERTGMVERVLRSVHNKTIYFIQATPKTLKWLATEDARCEVMTPQFLPTIIPPKPWTTPFEGGYWSGRVRNLTLIKTYNKNYLEELANSDMPLVYKAVNAMQRTGWTINLPVYEVAHSLWLQQSTLANIPGEDEALPERPLGIPRDMDIKDMDDEQQAAMTVWKRRASQVYDTNAKLKGKRLQFGKVMWIAEILQEIEEFYFPYQMDFRGRVYAVPMFLNPQGSDIARSLLTFSSAVPVGDADGEKWLAVHGAGLWGVDKVSLEARVEWVKEKERAIIASAEDPYHNLFWTEAEKPWQALAFCFEWAGYRREGYSFMSSLPCQMDGTCNGLQNFSAMLRDPVGGAAVNLIPADKPNDIYGQLAEVVAKKVEWDAANHEDEMVRAIAAGWVGKVKRKVTKRPVMTFCYGSKEYGFKTQVFDDIIQKWDEVYGKGEEHPWEGNGWAAAQYMGKLIWKSVGDVVEKAPYAMDWLQKVAKIAASEGLPVRWTTPAGLIVQQEYKEAHFERINLTFGEERVRLLVQTGSKSLDKRKQQSGISPNWVHSCDAAHMQLTVCAASDEGILSYSLIHDSYGTHAGNTQVLAEILREQFVQMYSGNILADFHQELLTQVAEGTDIPLPPAQGDLDLTLVLQSPFFFA